MAPGFLTLKMATIDPSRSRRAGVRLLREVHTVHGFAKQAEKLIQPDDELGGSGQVAEFRLYARRLARVVFHPHGDYSARLAHAHQFADGARLVVAVGKHPARHHRVECRVRIRQVVQIPRSMSGE